MIIDCYLGITGEVLLVATTAERSAVIVNVEAFACLVAHTASTGSTTWGRSTPFAPLPALTFAAREHITAWKVQVRAQFSFRS